VQKDDRHCIAAAGLGETDRITRARPYPAHGLYCGSATVRALASPTWRG
jgi:hypothetical protein